VEMPNARFVSKLRRFRTFGRSLSLAEEGSSQWLS
jgi:hypothetical protein